jgi:putative glycerol-1-phosphate prenyltransferase
MNKVIDKFNHKTGQIAILIDPDKLKDESQLKTLVQKAEWAKVDYIFIGGSTVEKNDFEQTILYLKKHTNLTLVVFPGSNTQISEKADALLYLSLLSGRNAEYLIGQHVQNADSVIQLGIEVIATSYLLIDGGKKTSVSYVSQTTPIPRHSFKIAENTAIAGYLQGKQLTFLDAGSGALESVPVEMIKRVKEQINTPVIVGGGVDSFEKLEEYKHAGANVVVIGNKIEEDIDFLLDIRSYKLNQSGK